MIGVQDKRDIQRTLGSLGRLGSVEQQKEICSMRKRAVGLDHLLPFAHAIVSRHDHGNLRGQPKSLADIGIVIVLVYSAS